jgi:hypothetical protein
MRAALGSLLLLALLGCASSDRLFRISPFRDSSADRVNLWPIAFVDRGAAAILWPLMDFDAKGFALRPLIAKDGSEYSVIYPFASWDGADDEGWVFPFYAFENHKGIFPLCHFGEFNYVGPFWWNQEGESSVSSYGLFPVAMRTDSLNYVGPLWWKESGDEWTAGGLFPIGAIGEFSYVGPFWWMNQAYGLFPLFSTGDFQHVGPLWWQDDWEKAGILPLAWWRADGSESAVLPLWFQRRQENEETTILLPFFASFEKGDERHIFTLLGDRSVSAEAEGFNLYPFWWSATTPSSKTRILLPLFYYEEEGSQRLVLTPLGGHGWDAEGQERFVNFLGPLFHRSVAEKQEVIAFLWPLFERRHSDDETSTRIFPFGGVTSRGEDSEAWWLLGSGHHQSKSGVQSWRWWPLVSYSQEDKMPGLFYEWTLLRRHATETQESLRFFPLFSTWSSGETFSHSWLAGFGQWRGNSEGSTLLQWPLYSQATGATDPSFLHYLSLVGYRGGAHESSLHLGTPLVYWSKSEEQGEYSSWSRRFLALFGWHHLQRPAPAIPELAPQSRRNLVESSGFEFLLKAIKSERREYQIFRPGVLTKEEQVTLSRFSLADEDREGLRSVLTEHEVEPAGDSDAALLAAIHELVGRSSGRLEVVQSRFPPLFNYEREGDTTRFNFLVRLIDVESSPDEFHLDLLYYLYRQHTEGGTTRRDIFPFLTWDSGPDETQIRFLWRLFSYERKGDQSRGHVFFVPWGDDF